MIDLILTSTNSADDLIDLSTPPVTFLILEIKMISKLVSLKLELTCVYEWLRNMLHLPALIVSGGGLTTNVLYLKK